MTSVLNSKKGSVLDMMWIAIIAVVLAITILIGWKIMSDVNTQFQASDSLNNESKEIMSERSSGFANLWDNIFLFVFVGSFIAALIASVFIDAHPVVFGISLFVLIIVVIIAAAMANVYGEMESSDDLSTEAADLTFIPFIMQNLVQVIIFMAACIMIVVFGKTRLGM